MLLLTEAEKMLAIFGGLSHCKVYITLFSINVVVLLFTAMTSYSLIFLLRFSCLYHHLDRL